MAPQVLEKKIALLFTYRKIVIIFKSVELEHTPSSFPQSKRWSATVQSQKKKKGSSRRIYSCFFTHNGITTPKTTREGQESTTKTSLHLAWPPKFKNQVLFTPRAQNRFLDLGLLLRGCRPKSRSLPGRVEVIQPVVRACTTFWLTSTRITLTRVHRQQGADELSSPGHFCSIFTSRKRDRAPKAPWRRRALASRLLELGIDDVARTATQLVLWVQALFYFILFCFCSISRLQSHFVEVNCGALWWWHQHARSTNLRSRLRQVFAPRKAWADRGHRDVEAVFLVPQDGDPLIIILKCQSLLKENCTPKS